jgi:hypothetical protein
MYTCDGINIHERKKVWEDKKESTREKETMRKNINKKNFKISRVLSTTYDGKKSYRKLTKQCFYALDQINIRIV